MNSHKDQLESLVDSLTLAQVLIYLSEIAEDKADHIRSNWQDSITAKPWDAAATKLASVAHKISV